MEIRLAGITEESIVDGPGLRLVVFAQGCPHHCQGCHNPDTHDVNSGYTLRVEDLFDYIQKRFAGNKILRGVTFSGGEPFLQAEPLGYLARRLKTLGLDIVCYSGFTFEQLAPMAITNKGVGKLLSQTDILIDGLYRAKERDLSLAFRGSRNQRLIDVAATVAAGRITLWVDASQQRWA